MNWPFVGVTKIELLNQLRDKNHHYEYFHSLLDHNIKVGKYRGLYQYIPQNLAHLTSKMTHCISEYL